MCLGVLDDLLGKVSNGVTAGGAFFKGNFFGLRRQGVTPLKYIDDLSCWL